MFNDEDSFAFKKMCEFSTVDGFVEITEGLSEMIKFVANEPSAGFFYIQQHTQNAVPNLVSSNNKVAKKSRDMSLRTEDSEDSITMVRSMKECGFPIVDEMIKDIKNSISIISSKQSKRGLVNSRSWSPAMWGRNRNFTTTGESSAGDTAGTGGYISDVFRSAKQRASSFKWPQVESIETSQTKGAATRVEDSHEDLHVDRSKSCDELVSLSEKYEEFKVSKEAKLEEWLGGTDNEDLHEVRSHGERI